MLLRHNPTLKKIYKFYANSKYIQKDNSESSDNENILGLTLAKFWILLKDLKILSPKMTIPSINRIFYQGAKNKYEIKSSIDELKQKISILKTISENNSEFPTLDTNELFIYDYCQKQKENKESDSPQKLNSSENNYYNTSQIKSNINIHDGGRVLLYRHFVEMIVRIAFLRCSEVNELHRDIENLIIQKLEPLIELKKKKNKDASFHSTVFKILLLIVYSSIKTKEHIGKMIAINQFKELKADVYRIFHEKIAKRQNFLYGVQDETILLKSFIGLLNV